MNVRLPYFIMSLLGTILFFQSSFSQSNLLNAKTPQEIGKLTEEQILASDEKPVQYGFVDDRDVLWSKSIWEIIPLNERVNFFYYYPTDTLNLGPERKSLFEILRKNIENGKITEVYDDDYFRIKIKYKDIQEKLVSIDTLEAGIEQLNSGEQLDEQYINYRTITAAEIRQYRIRGTWYFDQRLGEMKYRLLALAPVAPDVYTLDKPEDEQDLVELFWVWFPSTREILNKAKVYNRKNSAHPFSFDNLLNTRRFSSIIYKEENLYQDRTINSYIYDDALKQLLESERIKSSIRDFEQDMWNN